MIRRYIVLGCAFAFSFAHSIIDNRYFPLYKRSALRTVERPSNISSAIYFMTADEAKDDSNKKIGIPELWGKFDQVAVSKALTLVGKPNPLDPQFQTQRELIWDWEGKISSQGITVAFEKPVKGNWSIGMLWDIMHVQSRNEFVVSQQIKTDLMSPSDGKLVQLEQERRQINKELGLDAGLWSKTGLSDFDLYFRYSWLNEYCYKVRKFDGSVSLGILIPTSTKRDINNPASVPFGGNGHTGIYVSGDLNLELKEDWTFGIAATLLKRTPKTMLHRMPVNDEPIQYGAVVGDARVNPGWNFGLLGYLEVLDFWDTIGFRIGYNLVVHGKDKWCDKRKDKSVAVKLEEVEKHSNWVSEYARLGAVYNLCNIRQFKKIEPRLYLDVDVPVHLFWARDVCRTNRVSLGIEASF